MGVSDIVWQRAEMMQRTGHMVDAHIRAQFFYGPTGQVRTIPNNDGNGVLYANILSCVVWCCMMFVYYNTAAMRSGVCGGCARGEMPSLGTGGSM
jgi:hypothetical protein